MTTTERTENAEFSGGGTMEPQLIVETFGRLKITLNGSLLNSMLSAKGKGMVVYLVANPHSHFRDKLASYFMDEGQPTSSFRRELYELKQALQGCLEVTPASVKLCEHISYQFDAQLLERHIPTLCRLPVDEFTPECIKQLEDILHVYKGDFLDGLCIDTIPFQMWATILSINFQALAAAGWDKVIEYYLYTGDYVRGVSSCRRLLEVDKLRSESYCKMMILLAYLGQRSLVCRLFDEAKKRLEIELDSELPPHMVELYQQILNGAFPIDGTIDRSEIVNRRSIQPISNPDVN